jgi:hypothetical protein
MPGDIDQPVPREFEMWAARQVIRQHASADRDVCGCARCTPRGCTLLAWAEALVAEATPDPGCQR